MSGRFGSDVAGLTGPIHSGWGGSQQAKSRWDAGLAGLVRLGVTGFLYPIQLHLKHPQLASKAPNAWYKG